MTSGEPKPRRRSAPWLLGGLVLLLLSVLVALQVFGLWEVFTPDTAADALFLYALSSLVFIATFIFAFIFVRILLKLRRERRERQLGSKIKTRLVVYFITVSLLPITAMAVFSYLFFNRTLEKWFSSFPEDVIRQARASQHDEIMRQAQSLQDMASLAAALIEQGGWPETDENFLTRFVDKGRMSWLAIVSSEGAVLARSEADDGNRIQPGTLDQSIKRALQGDLRYGEMQDDNNKFNVAAVPLSDNRMLIAAREQRLNPQLETLVASGENFEEFKREQRKVRLQGLSTLGLLTLMILFAATWSAIHLARGIATPIRALAEAADEVAGGNLDYRVTAIADDELALLAESFNAMTMQLAENRRRIEANATELRDKNLALAERRDYIETVLESLSTGVVSLDASDCVTTINLAALTMLHLESAPPAGTLLSEIVSAEDHALLNRALRRARLRGRAAEQIELARSNAPDVNGSSVVPVALTATALNSLSGEGRGVVFMMEDLSELLTAQRAAAWSEVARRMAHEIKNPLTPIQLSAERIARSFQRSVSGEYSSGAPSASPSTNGKANGDAVETERVKGVVEECTTTITREVAGLKAMVDEFTRFARLPHARLELADVNEVVRQTVVLYEDRLGDVRLDVRLASAPPAAMLDAEQLRRLFVNLIDNALEAMTDGSSIEQRITVATGHDPSRGLLLVEVADTGHGIARADFSRLFQPYFSTRGRGTGLGLAIVQRIITEHGGRIRAEANRPRGARFIIELPVAEDAKQGPGDGGQGSVKTRNVLNTGP